MAAGGPCQDASFCLTLPEAVFLAVADGAGSALLSDVGAQLAAKTAGEALGLLSQGHGLPPEDEALEDLLRRAAFAAKEAVQIEASAREHPSRDLASTLLLVAAESGRVAALQIGDGAVVLESRDHELFSLTKPETGEFINETTFLTSDNAASAAQVRTWRGDVSHIAVFSDGLQLLALQMPHWAPFRGFFAPIFRFLEDCGDRVTAERELQQSLSSPRISAKTDDDLTLVIASLRTTT